MNKIVKIMLGIFGALGLLLLSLILLCQFRPGMSDAISDFLYRNEKSSAKSDTSENVTFQDAETDADPEELKRAALEIPMGLDRNALTISYEPLPDSEINPPAELVSLAGLIPVVDEGIEIKPKEAEALKEELGYGNTGEGLEFDPVMYPYYQMLTEELKPLYRQIYANACDRLKRFAPVVLAEPKELKSVFQAVIGDHPELFFIETGYQYKYSKDGTCEIDLIYNRTIEDFETANTLFQNEANNIIQQASGLADDYEKEVMIHDLLMNKITYNKSAPMNQSAYSAFVSGETVCAGYARAFQYACMQLGIPCYYCSGYAGENHAWNIIKLSDGFYNVDVTWDDTNPSTYDFFNCSDADYAKDHVRKDLSVYLPPCNGTQYRGLLNGRNSDTSPVNQESGESAETQSAPEPARLRTYMELGYTSDDIVRDIKQYNDACYKALKGIDPQKGNEYTFTQLVNGNGLLQEIAAKYQNDDYKNAFMNEIMEKKEFPACGFQVTVEELEDHYFLLTHHITW